MSPAKVLAWLVHLYTGLGLIIAAAIALLIVRGDAAAFREAFALMGLATLIDATDGWLARRARVKAVVPTFDGRRLDDIVDFQTYTSLPLLLLWRAAVLPEGWDWLLLLPLLASAYGFCQVYAKTDDGYFLGFPSYWNIVALYVYVLPMPGFLAVGLITAFTLLTFVPSKYLYTTQPGRLNAYCNVLAGVWTAMLMAAWWAAEGGDFSRPTARGLAFASLFYPVFYLAVSWGISLGVWGRVRH